MTDDIIRALRYLEWPGPEAAEEIESNIAREAIMVAVIERLRTTVNDQAATITGLLREIDRLLARAPNC